MHSIHIHFIHGYSAPPGSQHRGLLSTSYRMHTGFIAAPACTGRPTTFIFLRNKQSLHLYSSSNFRTLNSGRTPTHESWSINSDQRYEDYPTELSQLTDFMMGIFQKHNSYSKFRALSYLGLIYNMIFSIITTSCILTNKWMEGSAT